MDEANADGGVGENRSKGSGSGGNDSGGDGSSGKGSRGNEHGDWYRYGQAVLSLEMLIAVLVTVFSLYMAFQGRAGFLT